MNERIKELYGRAMTTDEYGYKFNPEQFAELIVRECLKMCDEVHRDYGMASDTARISKRYIKEHFGVTE